MPDVRRELRESTREFEEVTLQMFDLLDPVCLEWTEELRKLDPLLSLGKAKERAHAPGVRPGFYHLIRRNDGAPLWVNPLTIDGEFVEPSSAMLDGLRRADLQNSRAVQARREQEAREAAERASAELREDEDRQAEILERWQAAK